MPERALRYAGVFERPYSDARHPETLIRHWSDGVRDDAEVLTDRGEWRPTRLLDEVVLGLTHDEVEPVTRAQARAFADAWRRDGRLAALPSDLADPPVGAL